MREYAYKRLRGIEPFNRFSFRSCLIHQLIAAYGRYGVGEELFLTERFPVYRVEDGIPYADTVELISRNESETLTGIRQIRKDGCASVADYLVRAVGRGDPVLVGVDCFYLPYRADVWQKEHFSHYLLVYGYDKAAEEFIVNEHLYRSSYRYSETRIPFSRLTEAHTGFENTLLRRGGAGLIRVHRFKKTEFDPGRTDFLKRIRAKAEALVTSLGHLEETVTYIHSTVSGEEIFWKEQTVLTDYIRIIKEQKNVQRYQIKLLGMPEAEQLTERIMENFNFIYSVLGKMSVKGVWQRESAEKICARSAEILRLEQALCKVVLEEGQ